MRDFLLYVDDIRDSGMRILEYTQGLTFEQFSSNRMIIDAVIRNFEIIGEAVMHIPESVQNQYPDVPWRSIKGMRNLLVHEYWGVDLTILWETIRESIPQLIKAID